MKLLTAKQTTHDAQNRIAAHAILERPEQHGPAELEWAGLVMKRMEESCQKA